MKFLNILPVSLGLGLAMSANFAGANTTLLENADFSSGTEPWIAGSNQFVGDVWQAFVGSADGTYTVDSRVDPDGAGNVFVSWDDGSSDKLENYLFQEYGAGPLESTTPTIFQTGDVIVFKGSASATKAGTDTSDVVVRAFIKTLGYNELGWAFQVKPEYSVFHEITGSLESFELSMTYPDLTVDDSLQVIQMGFEITTSYDGAAMDSGSIYFENLEGYVEGDTAATWHGYEVIDGWVNTGSYMGWLYVAADPWIISQALGGYIYLAPGQNFETAAGSWVYRPR